MKPVSVAHLIVIAVVSAVCGAVVNSLLIQRGLSPLLVSYFLAILYLLISALLSYYGVLVRRWRARKSDRIDALTAARVAVTARSCAYVGSGSVGIFVGILLPCLARIDAPAMQMCVTRSLVAAVAALVLTVIALIVERWCVVDMSDDDDSNASQASRSASPA